MNSARLGWSAVVSVVVTLGMAMAFGSTNANVSTTASTNEIETPSTTVFTVPPETVPTPKVNPEERMAKAILAFANQERAAAGLAPLNWSDDLAGVGTKWSKTMATSGGFKHQDLNAVIEGRNPELKGMGENIIEGGKGFTAAQIHQVWMDSPSHRENILKPDFDQLGIGVVCKSDGVVFVTQQFGTTTNFTPPALKPKAITKGVVDGSDSTCGG